MKSILDRSFKYVPSHGTDIRRTFERARQQQEAKSSANKVLPLNSARKSAQTA